MEDPVDGHGEDGAQAAEDGGGDHGVAPPRSVHGVGVPRSHGRHDQRENEGDADGGRQAARARKQLTEVVVLQRVVLNAER